MTVLLLALLLLQGTPAPRGFATGFVRSASGSPAAGVRVYAVPAGDPNAVSAGATVFESLAQTDASGRYRLEIPVGRYFIAVGSVTSPTYYPDTPSVASAKAISIAAGSTVEDVDFSRYVTAGTSTSGGFGGRPAATPGSMAVLSGVVRASDGSGAPGVLVFAVPVLVTTFVTAGTTGYQFRKVFSDWPGSQPAVGTATTDGQGRYQIVGVSRGSYILVVGTSDSQVYYPGTSDFQSALAVETDPTTLLTSLDFALPPSPKAFSIRGRVLSSAGRPVDGVSLLLRPVNPGVALKIESLLPGRTYITRTAVGDGSFEIANVTPGKYSLQVLVGGKSLLTKAVEVTDHSVELDFSNQSER